jgi:hypothetical protein
MGIKQLIGYGTGYGSTPGPTELLIRAATLLIVKEVRKVEAKIMGQLDSLIAKVSEQSSVVASASVLIDGLQDKLEAALKAINEGADPVKLQAIIDTLEADKAKLIEAMKENTVAVLEPTPVPDPVPVDPVPVPTDEFGNPI